MRTGNGDIHGIEKITKEPITKYIDLKSNVMNFNTVSFYRGPKILLSFGNNEINGNSSTKFKAFLGQKIKKSAPQQQYNWGNLFKSEKYRAQAAQIKNVITEEGPSGLNQLGFNGQQIGTIMKLIK